MADITDSAPTRGHAPSGAALTSAEIERASEFAREPILLEGEEPGDLAPGTARYMAVRDALAELDDGAEHPSMKWRSDYSLFLGLERVLDEDPPLLKDGAELSAHQIDALSGTLAALTLELEQRNGNGRSNGAAKRGAKANGAGDEAEAAAVLVEPEENGLAEVDAEAEELLAEDEEEPQDWDEQEAEDVEQIEEAPEDPGANRRFWFEHATGAGKTVAAVGFVEASRTGGILILTHRRNLVDQFIGEISDRGYAERLSPPLLGDSDHPYGPVTVETYQWFVRNAGKVSNAYSIVICDEAHTALGEKTSACIRNWQEPVFIGMTATGALIARHVADLFPTQTSRFDLAQAARRGVIAPLRCIRIPPGPGVRTIAKVPLRKGEVDQDFDQEELAKLLDQAPFNVAIADLYRSRFRRVPGVVYTAGVKHATNVAAAFREAGINARAVSGETPKRELNEILAAFERGEVDVLCNAMLLAEGWNSPARDDLHAPRPDRLAPHLPAARRPRHAAQPGQGGGARDRPRPSRRRPTTRPSSACTACSTATSTAAARSSSARSGAAAAAGSASSAGSSRSPPTPSAGWRCSSASSGGSRSRTSTTPSSTSGRRWPARG